MKLNSVMWTSECVAQIRVVQITFSYKIRMRCTRSYMSNIQIAIFSETLRQHNCFDLKLSMQELLIDSPILTFKFNNFKCHLLDTFLAQILLPTEQKLSNLKSFNEKTFLSEAWQSPSFYISDEYPPPAHTIRPETS